MEDRLSDALHERLTQRFIDRRTSVLMKHLREDEFAVVTLDEAGGVSIGGEADRQAGRLPLSCPTRALLMKTGGPCAPGAFMAAPCGPPR